MNAAWCRSPGSMPCVTSSTSASGAIVRTMPRTTPGVDVGRAEVGEERDDAGAGHGRRQDTRGEAAGALVTWARQAASPLAASRRPTPCTAPLVPRSAASPHSRWPAHSLAAAVPGDAARAQEDADAPAAWRYPATGQGGRPQARPATTPLVRAWDNGTGAIALRFPVAATDTLGGVHMGRVDVKGTAQLDVGARLLRVVDVDAAALLGGPAVAGRGRRGLGGPRRGPGRRSTSCRWSALPLPSIRRRPPDVRLGLTAPEIHVRRTPTVLVQIDGEPINAQVGDVPVEHVANTQSDLFRNVNGGRWFLLGGGPLAARRVARRPVDDSGEAARRDDAVSRRPLARSCPSFRPWHEGLREGRHGARRPSRAKRHRDAEAGRAGAAARRPAVHAGARCQADGRREHGERPVLPPEDRQVPASDRGSLVPGRRGRGPVERGVRHPAERIRVDPADAREGARPGVGARHSRGPRGGGARDAARTRGP